MPLPFTVSASAAATFNILEADPTPSSSSIASLIATVTATATSSAIAAASTTSSAAVIYNEDAGGILGGGEGECRLLGPFALLVQLALGGLALLSLVYKRWRERPQRPLKIWFFDASKQVFGSVLVHAANIFMSMLTSGRFSLTSGKGVETVARALLRREEDMPYVPNPCSFYLLNLAIDTTIGIPILIILLRLLTALASYTPFGNPYESIQSGNYGSPPKALWWLKQSVIYFCGLFGMKICVLIIFLILPWISRVGDWALGWTEGNEKLQIFFVMMLFPLIMNGIQYYIIDSFIKKRETHTHERLPQDDRDDERDPFDDSFGEEDSDGLLSSDDDDDEDDAGHGTVPVESKSSGKGGAGPNAHEEYDPDLDGQTVVGSTKSLVDGGKILPRELVPHE
ncbi:vacuolar membrane protein-domain-containing protein [Astrocystis sublimbata]|nr:vacuolar membrane protein-domain-containing protein [Astrocystis sublimbata]